MDDSFYITLPSNVKNPSFTNTVANFKTKLVQRIDLKGNWLVGMASISYTNSWYNLTINGDINIRYFDEGNAKILLKEPEQVYPGRYDKIEDLIGMINHKLKNLNSKAKYDNFIFPELVYEEKSKIVSIKLGFYKNRYVYPDFSENLCKMLGFDREDIYAITGTAMINFAEKLNSQTESTRNTYHPLIKPKNEYIHAKKPYSLAIDFHSLYVYCDIVKHSFVGDSLSPLLRFVEIPPNYSYGEQIVCTYPDTHYLPLVTNEFETIEIAIRNDTGILMPFESGRSIVVLHFKKIS